ncbi:MAG: hypothetical protein AB2704_07215 [Candidatus Thiodiazotropha taylori]
MEERVKYRINRDVASTHYEYLHGKNLSSITKQTYFLYLLWVAAGFSAIYVSVISNQPIFVLFFVVVFAINISFFMRNFNVRKNAIAVALNNYKQKDVEIVFTDEGMTEIACGITSFAPWSSVQKVDIYKNSVFIQLANGLWAILPPHAINNHPKLHEKIMSYYNNAGNNNA